MAFLDSPGVSITEQDLSSYVSGSSFTTGGFSGAFTWGPCNVPTLVSNQTDLQTVFGTPLVGYNQADYYSVAYFLKYSSGCYVTRIVGANAFNAVGVVTGSAVGKEVLINNYHEFETSFTNPTSVDFVAKYPGSLGNGVNVVILDSITFGSSPYKNLFDSAPSGAELHVLIVKNSAVLEKYPFLSAVPGTISSDGTPAYYVDVLNQKSDYVYITRETGACDVVLTGGTLSGTFATAGSFARSLYAGTGNGTVIYLIDYANYASFSTDIQSHLTAIPATGKCAIVVYVNGFFTEKFEGLDKDPLAALYYVNAFNAGSTTAHLLMGIDFTQPTQTTLTLTGATLNTHPGDLVLSGYNLMADADTYDIALMFAGSAGSTIQSAVVSIAEQRKYTVGFCSPQFASVSQGGSAALTAVLADRQAIYSSSYGYMDSNWVQIYDPINKNNFWMAANPISAGLQAQVENLRAAWYVGYGTTYGKISGVKRLAWEQSQSVRDQLYKSQINPLSTFKNEGILLFGSKTLQVKPSAFDRLNVRRLFILIEKAVSKTMRGYIGELNTAQTRRSVVNAIVPFLRDIKSKQGLYDFACISDETNNTPQVIDTNSLAVDLYLKPSKTIDFVYVTLTAVSSGVNFKEVIGGA